MAKTIDPIFLKSRAKLDRWRERYNPFRGLTMRRLTELLEECDRGEYISTMWLLRKMERRDETIRACKRRMSDEVKKLKWNVHLPEDLPPGVSEAQAKQQQEWLRARYEAIDNLKEAFGFTVGAELRGFAHLEKHYGEDGLPNHLEPVPQWHWWKDGFYGVWMFDDKANGHTRQGDAIEPEHWLIHEVDDPWFEIAMIAALRKILGDKDFDAFVEDYGIPWFFLISPPGSSDGKADEFQDVADKVAGDGRGVLPHGSDVKGPPGNAATNASIFVSHLEEQRKRIVLAATGGLLTMLTASGSGTLAGSAHQEAWENIVGGAAKSVSEMFQEQFDKPLLQEQFPGQPIVAYFELAYPEADEARADFVKDLEGLHRAGYRVKHEVVESKTGMELEPAAGPTDLPGKSATSPPPGAAVKNRFGQTKDSLRLAENALADVLSVGADYLEPLSAPLQRLIALAESETATADDFQALATQLQQTFPELLGEALDVERLADVLEPVLGSAAVLGARDEIRRRAQA